MFTVALAESFVPPSVAVTVSSRSFCADGVSYSSSHVTSWPAWSTSRTFVTVRPFSEDHTPFSYLAEAISVSAAFTEAAFTESPVRRVSSLAVPRRTILPLTFGPVP